MPDYHSTHAVKLVQLENHKDTGKYDATVISVRSSILRDEELDKEELTQEEIGKEQIKTIKIGHAIRNIKTTRGLQETDQEPMLRGAYLKCRPEKINTVKIGRAIRNVVTTRQLQETDQEPYVEKRIPQMQASLTNFTSFFNRVIAPVNYLEKTKNTIYFKPQSRA